MPRKRLIYTSEFPYHITNRSNNREFFLIGLNVLWPIFMRNLNEIRVQFGCQIHAFVLMSNHYHLVISTPRSNIGEAMKYFHREIARAANKYAGRINHFFGGRYKWTVIGHDNYYWNSLKYVFRNPVRAGVCAMVEDYPFSSLNSEPGTLVWEMLGELDAEWLNEPFPEEIEEAIRKGLRRREFALPANKSGKAIRLDPAQRKKGTVT